ncbi:hypothetical protein [Mesobacillus zeae]|uniref:YodN n=1 Tax=Mesobacillus zeae TaxID=1917180 RepID=A0A398B7N8_9BACI|nr:hypothetical protein [Mesobacillus zeae]RID85504.1 hypothetical protein D1970_07975 [Mesobacillus zeae]
MDKRKEPKYKIGDTVVITIYGTVGKVTNVKWLDGLYVYEINRSDGLYLESSLELLSEYEGKLAEKEHIDIEYRFFFGDLVQVKGYGPDLFKIVGFRTEIWRYKEDAWEDVIYELSRIKDGEWLEAGEEELTLVADAENAETAIKKMGLASKSGQRALPSPEKVKKPVLRKAEKEQLMKMNQKNYLIDSLLDIYNDYSILYQWFGDDEYADVMDHIVLKLSSILGEDSENAL